jgi:RNA polymerase sigma-70 factor (ECF subfamily)
MPAIPSVISNRRSIITCIVQRQTFDSGYVQRLAQSDPATERDFTAYFGELLAIKLRSRLRSPDLIQDVTQETFLRVLKTLRQNGVANPEALGSFVNSVCNNVLFELYRQQSRITEEPEERISGEPPVDHELVSAEERREVRAVVDELPEKDRMILRWLFFEEREKEEVCRTLGVDREYLRVLLHRAKNRFRVDWVKRSATKGTRPTPLG